MERTSALLAVLLDTPLCQVEIQKAPNGTLLVIQDGRSWVEVPVTCPDEIRAAWRLSNRLSEALERVARATWAEGI